MRRQFRRAALKVCSLVLAALVSDTLLQASIAAVAGPGDPPVEVMNDGSNAHPVRLQRPARAPLSAVALLGKALFFDPMLSGSHQVSCASCHDPGHAYGPAGNGPVEPGGQNLQRFGHRAAPSLMYRDRQPRFHVQVQSGEDSLADDGAAQSQVARARTLQVPAGGFFWDGRANTLQEQALSPLLNPDEMANRSEAALAAVLRKRPYAKEFASLFGAMVLGNASLLVAEASFALARFQIEEPTFHPYSSRFDYWLEGRARLRASEVRGWRVFRDKMRGNCAACHPDVPDRDGRPPVFTDYQFEALGVARNAAVPANRDRHFFDLGLCGPDRTDLSDKDQYCGMFATPSLRNVATRRFFFHNGKARSLREAIEFYNLRDTRPGQIYPLRADGSVHRFNDLPQRYQVNVDVSDAPLDRHPGDAPAMSDDDVADLMAFLQTLTDGYLPLEP